MIPMGHLFSSPPWAAGRALKILCGNKFCALLQVKALVDPTLQHKNRAEVVVDGPEIIRPVRMRQA